MKTRALLLPLLLLFFACQITTNAPAPAPSPRGMTEMQESTVSPGRSEVVYILVERDSTTGALQVSPDPAVVYGNQKVEWIALDPNLKIMVDWKSGVGLDRPCPAPARRCGRKAFPVKVRTRAAYSVKAYDAADALVAEIDPILDILPAE